jgi:hypothetical protein
MACAIRPQRCKLCETPVLNTAVGYDHSVIQNANPVTAHDGADPMADQHNGAFAFQVALESILKKKSSVSRRKHRESEN